MGWHVQRVRGRGSNLRIAPRCRKSQLSHAGNVVGMNQVVRNSGMLRLNHKQFFKDGGGLLSSRMCGIIIAVGFFQSQGIKCCRLVIVGITAVELLHGFQISVTALVVLLLRMSIDRCFGSDVVPLAGGCCVQRFRNFDLVPSSFALLFIWSSPPAEGRGNSPMGHGTM